ncbi:Zn-dependent protease [Flavobacterium jejuense]|uniref:Zn-dependent protease n=1 Tax=Flavobacterium jejuense TaxID=1544455 RepID=A0ABX0IKN9_9FLAO|nr:archaemetzincin [Flavobacterium jejuense]NHN24377.1 Zn-dependent protease [Flavobacterium jejuense]
MKRLLFVLMIFTLFFCKEEPQRNKKKEHKVKSTKVDFKLPNYLELALLDDPLPDIKPGDWLSTHDENGQSFDQYFKNEKLVSPLQNKNIIYIQPIGSFTVWEKKIIDWNTKYIQLFFGLKTVQLKPISEKNIPKTKKRIHFGNEQLDATYIIHSLLPKKMPKDGIVIMALTAKDLYPHPKWNYVFGLASYQRRTGVSSIFRYSNENLNEKNYSLCLKRIIRTSTHEISHMFSVSHCISAVCLMNGANNLEEADSRPNSLCSECLTKLSWNLNFDNLERMDSLIHFMNEHHLEDDAIILGKQREIIAR